MQEDYAPHLQAGAANELRLDADIRLLGEKPCCLLQQPGEYGCAGGIAKAKVQHGLQTKLTVQTQQAAGAVAAPKAAEGTQQRLGLGGHSRGDAGLPLAAKSPDAKVKGQDVVVEDGEFHRGGEKQKQEKNRHGDLHVFDG